MSTTLTILNNLSMNQGHYHHRDVPPFGRLDAAIIILSAIAQGLVLWFFIETDRNILWLPLPFTYALVIVVPTTFQLLVSLGRIATLASIALGVGTLIASLMFYMSWSAVIEERQVVTHVFFTAFASLFIMWFVALPFIQSKLSSKEWLPGYATLYFFAWRNTVTFLFTLLFVLIAWLLLFFWGALFNIIDITFFSMLFEKKLFAFSATGLFVGTGITIGRTQERAVEVAHLILLSLLKWLLPALCLILVGFLLSVPITGLTQLLDAEVWSPVGVLFIGLVLLITFVNGVYRDGRQTNAYSMLVNKFISLTLIIAPIFAIISAYGLWIRIDKYGLTVDRYWAVVIIALLSCYVFGYAAAQIRSRGDVLRGLGDVNIFLAMGIIVILFLSNTPVLNPMRLSADNQIERLLSSKIDAADFDYSYLRFSLGRFGNDALRELTEKTQEQWRTERERASKALQATSRQQQRSEFAVDRIEDRLNEIKWLPREALKRSDLIDMLTNDASGNQIIEQCVQNPTACRFLAIDLNNDSDVEHILIRKSTKCARFSPVYKEHNGAWKEVARMELGIVCFETGSSIWESEIKTETPHWRNLIIGENTLSILPKK